MVMEPLWAGGRQVLLELSRFEVLPGQRLVLRDVTWSEFEEIMADLGDRRPTRIAYDRLTLEIVTPLPEHQYIKEIVSDLLKALMEELDIDFCCLGSTTFRKNESQGLEPDQCFYIKNEAAVRGKKRLDMNFDPPPDLALEVDLTSRTYPDIYASLRVPELWQFQDGQMQIKILQDGEYVEVLESPNFPGLALTPVIPTFLRQSEVDGRMAAIKAFRRWIQNQS
jgi:Uma2 family endonuclease